MTNEKSIFAWVLCSCIVAVLSVPTSYSLPGVNKHVTNGRARAAIREGKVFRNAETRKVEFPDQIDVVMDVDGASRRVNAKKMEYQRPALRVLDMNGQESKFRHKDVAFYTTDDGVVGLIYEENTDGTTRTRVASRTTKNRRFCSTNGERSSCWTVKKPKGEGVRDVVDDIGSRSKRQLEPIATVDDYDTTELMLEIAVLVDQSWMEIFRSRNGKNEGAAVEDAALYMTMLMAEMNHMFRSVGEVSKAEIDIPDFELLIYGTMMIYPPRGQDFNFITLTDSGEISLTGSKSDSFEKYRKWVGNHYDTLLDRNFDHVAFITRCELLEQICGDYLLHLSNFSRYFETGILGQVPALGGTCRDWSLIYVRYMLSVNSDHYADVLQTLAHEILHTLGAAHDNSENCPDGQYIMSATLIEPGEDTRDTFLKFSKCTVEQAYNHIHAMRTTYGRDCLAESITSEQWTRQFCTGDGRGEIWDIDFQCQRQSDNITFNTECSSNIITISGEKLVPADACYDDGIVRCGPPSTDECIYDLYSVTDGTPCYTDDSSSNMVCHRGECRSKVDVCGSVDGLTTETIDVQELPCRCHEMKGKLKKRCCAKKRREDGSCCPGCDQRGSRCAVRNWRPDPFVRP